MSMQIVTEQEEYHPGDVVRGYVRIVITKPIKARGIYVSFEGREHTAVTRGSGKNSHTYIQNVMIVQDTITAWSPGADGLVRLPAIAAGPFRAVHISVPGVGVAVLSDVPVTERPLEVKLSTQSGRLVAETS